MLSTQLGKVEPQSLWSEPLQLKCRLKFSYNADIDNPDMYFDKNNSIGGQKPEVYFRMHEANFREVIDFDQRYSNTILFDNGVNQDLSQVVFGEVCINVCTIYVVLALCGQGAY